jgi:hypothetical protein
MANWPTFDSKMPSVWSRPSASSWIESRGSHHIYRHRVIAQRINLQARGGEAKPYQLRQLLDLMERYALGLKEEGP